ncbi:uncharacterized protein LOC101454365 [Ceratitis capitata]|uniref:uncharacterized protein LOC101454365 n=1 Tax=Ceratitis capitata TaxID=7213 RepID=UPI0003297507|nr:uncharacterized protein LOC101454365 [Ceratitis capitata]
MLKWAVNAPRLSYLTVDNTKACAGDLQLEVRNEQNGTSATQAHTPSTQRERLKRKSSDFYHSRRLQHWLEKENALEVQNQVTSTPLHANSKTHSSSCPLRRLNSFKNLSNIMAGEKTEPNTPLKPFGAQFETPGHSVVCKSIRHNDPANYAATLPTLEVEYSPPCSLVPGPILALRGLGIADTYFDKPRYLPPQERLEQNQTTLNHQTAASKTDNTLQNHPLSRLPSIQDDAASLSSSKMGDQTLERMIDAILESTMKEKRSMKFIRHANCAQSGVMSPTYTPAEDPANDLCEFWSNAQRAPTAAQTQPMRKKRFSLPVNVGSAQEFSEREVRSPHGAAQRLRRLQAGSYLHLRRQRAVRRKRKTSKSSGKSTKTQRHVDTAAPPADLAESKTIENPSPDSGHNSCSELDDNSSALEDVCLPLASTLDSSDWRTLDATKRRLSFSNKTLTNGRT